jgi:hypothetical protein
VAVSEGLATYCELWTRAQTRVGQVNGYRLKVLKDPKGGEWVPAERLLTDDSLFENEGAEQLAYAEAWLLIYHHMQGSEVKKLRAYLQAIRPRRDAGHRAEDASAAFGNLVRLDTTLKRKASLLR